MIEVQRHRGPDGRGFRDATGASLGHCRLAIIDPTDAGHQPMADPDGRYWITFNGEIYNYIELAEELRSSGYRFRGRSDTEVLLAAYQTWGAGCLERLRGMFAFAVWDEKTQCLFAARDRLGIKPLHYWTDGSRTFAFASEIKALIDLLPRRRANERLAREYLAWNLVDHDGTETMLRDVSRLPAAHLLRVRPGERPSIERYWDVKFSDRLDTAPSDREQTIAQFRSLLEETVALHLRSDVPVGSSLSGGLDSSAIVCLASRELQRRNAWREDWQHTFTACFDDPALDERQYAELVARRAGCHPHFVWPRGERLREDLERWVWHQEEPVGGAGVYSQYCVARLASETGVKVLLDGQGADEQLAGYRKFGVVHVRDLLRRGRYGNALAAAAGLLGRELLQPKILDDAWRYLGGTTAGVSQLWPRGDMPERPAAFLLRGSLAERLEQDLRRFSLPALLRYEDRNSMAFGIEARVPFVDHVVVESIAALAADMKIRNGWTKRILRDALVRVVPDEIRLRKRKVYFDAPEAAWLRGPLSEWLADTLQETRHLPQIVDAGAVRHLHLRFTSSRREDSLAALLFRLGMYEAWARRFLEDGASVRLDCPAIAPNL